MTLRSGESVSTTANGVRWWVRAFRRDESFSEMVSLGTNGALSSKTDRKGKRVTVDSDRSWSSPLGSPWGWTSPLHALMPTPILLLLPVLVLLLLVVRRPPPQQSSIFLLSPTGPARMSDVRGACAHCRTLSVYVFLLFPGTEPSPPFSSFPIAVIAALHARPAPHDLAELLSSVLCATFLPKKYQRVF